MSINWFRLANGLQNARRSDLPPHEHALTSSPTYTGPNSPFFKGALSTCNVALRPSVINNRDEEYNTHFPCGLDKGPMRFCALWVYFCPGCTTYSTSNHSVDCNIYSNKSSIDCWWYRSKPQTLKTETARGIGPESENKRAAIENTKCKKSPVTKKILKCWKTRKDS